MNSKTCIIITGPTAVGKTNVSLALAQHFNTAIISADSRQCYKELNIGVAKPDAEQLGLIKHYFINSHAVTEDVNAAIFEQYALNAVNEIFLSHDTAIMVGGTGLYIRAFCEGMDAIPAVNTALRQEINTRYRQEGLAWLQNQIKQKDPRWAVTGDMQNPQRMMRALEIVSATGKSIMEFRQGKKTKRNFDIIKIGLELPRPLLYRNINNRVDQMIKEGLVTEVHSLQAHRKMNALQTVGYTELFAFFDGDTDMNTATELIKRNTRHYAKRQLTWFKKDLTINWFSEVDHNQIINYFHNLV